jgi:hypothetical protein
MAVHAELRYVLGYKLLVRIIFIRFRWFALLKKLFRAGRSTSSISGDHKTFHSLAGRHGERSGRCLHSVTKASPGVAEQQGEDVIKAADGAIVGVVRQRATVRVHELHHSCFVQCVVEC